jgi:hypothetical protein
MISEIFPWADVISGGGGLGVFISALWMFLKHMKETQEQTNASAAKKNETTAQISKDFSDTVRAVSSDVKAGLDKLSETTNSLLADSREREARLHALMHTLTKEKA